MSASTNEQYLSMDYTIDCFHILHDYLKYAMTIVLVSAGFLFFFPALSISDSHKTSNNNFNDEWIIIL